MQTQTQCQIHLAACKNDDSRPSLNYVRIEPDGTAVATDGHILAKVPGYLMPDNGELADGPLYVLAKQLGSAAKSVESVERINGCLHYHYGSRKASAAVPVKVEKADGCFEGERSYCEERFPKYDRVIPDPETWPAAQTVKLGINADLLLRLAKALGANPQQAIVELTIKLEPTRADEPQVKSGRPPLKPWRCVSGMFAKVRGSDGIGVIMPVSLA